MMKRGQHSTVLLMACCIAAFMAGSLWTTIVVSNMSSSSTFDELKIPSAPAASISGKKRETVLSGRERRLLQILRLSGDTPESLQALLQQRNSPEQKSSNAVVSPASKKEQPQQMFPKSVKKFAVGMARVNKDNFTQQFDMGVPTSKKDRGMEDVLILYKGGSSLPNVQSKEATEGAFPLLSSDEATMNCDSMHVILTETTSPKTKQCIAIVPQYPSFHIQNWMRVDPTKKQDSPVDSQYALRIMGRGYQQNGVYNFEVPLDKHVHANWDMLQTYFASLPDVKKELARLVKPMARNNAIVVMVCNYGQSELLMNFACSAKSRGISIDHVLVFATDTETKQLAEELGITSYHDKRNFGDAPSEAAGGYGDKVFRAMMMTKSYCVHQISQLGYDVLFQDVDMVWFRDPLPFFQNAVSPLKDFDVYFQEDGSRHKQYAPYSANTGFYFVRNNAKTRHFLTSVLFAGDSILHSRSHQQPMTPVLAEHSSLYGMRVKVFNADTTDEFPGGYHFHNRPDWMKSMLQGENKHNPYIFHMCWTKNKDNKLIFLQQMGEWYVRDECIGQNHTTRGGFLSGETCCSAEPLVRCHYRDKPSKIPCPDSPNIDKDGRSFW